MLSPSITSTTLPHYAGEADRSLSRDDHVLALVKNAVLIIPVAFGRWLKGRHTRQVLAALDEHQLRDIGLRRAELSKL